MKIHKKAQFIVPYLGGQSAVKGRDFWDRYMEDRIKNALLPEKQKKMEQVIDIEARDAIYNKALSIFNYALSGFDTKEVPIIGNWMLKSCLMESAYQLGLTGKGGDLPGRGILEGVLIEPYAIFLYRKGKIIEGADRLDLNTFKPRGSRTGIVKVRECIEPPAEFEFDVTFDEKLIKTEYMDQILDKMRWTGLGPYRQKMGKFEYVE